MFAKDSQNDNVKVTDDLEGVSIEVLQQPSLWCLTLTRFIIFSVNTLLIYIHFLQFRHYTRN